MRRSCLWYALHKEPPEWHGFFASRRTLYDTKVGGGDSITYPSHSRSIVESIDRISWSRDLLVPTLLVRVYSVESVAPKRACADRIRCSSQIILADSLGRCRSRQIANLVARLRYWIFYSLVLRTSRILNAPCGQNPVWMIGALWLRLPGRSLQNTPIWSCKEMLKTRRCAETPFTNHGQQTLSPSFVSNKNRTAHSR